MSCCVAATGGKALPACPTQLSLRLSPFTPENSGIARKHLFTPDVWLQPFWKSGRSHFWFNEAASGSLALRLTGSLHGASAQQLLTALSVSLHAGRSVHMMNTFQFISLVGGAGAPKVTKKQKIRPPALGLAWRAELCDAALAELAPPLPKRSVTFVLSISFC